MNPFVIAFRRIIYSIPLKRLLLGLAVFGVLFASFSSAEYVSSLINNVQQGSITVKPFSEGNTLLYNINGDYGIYCLEAISISNNSISNFEFGITYDQNVLNSDIAVFLWQQDLPQTVCLPYHLDYFVIHNVYESSFTLNYKLFRLDTLLNTQIPVYSSMQCQTEYNLIPISSVDQNYCTTNNLCPSGGTPSDCPNVGVSNLYINDIFHPGAFNVIMNIPEEIDWDYAYTNSGTNFNVDIVGYNQDFEKIEGWIETNNYKPSSDDFTNVFLGFIPFSGLLVACLFVILVFYFIKKIFK